MAVSRIQQASAAGLAMLAGAFPVAGAYGAPGPESKISSSQPAKEMAQDPLDVVCRQIITRFGDGVSQAIGEMASRFGTPLNMNPIATLPTAGDRSASELARQERFIICCPTTIKPSLIEEAVLGRAVATCYQEPAGNAARIVLRSCIETKIGSTGKWRPVRERNACSTDIYNGRTDPERPTRKIIQLDSLDLLAFCGQDKNKPDRRVAFRSRVMPQSGGTSGTGYKFKVSKKERDTDSLILNTSCDR